MMRWVVSFLTVCLLGLAPWVNTGSALAGTPNAWDCTPGFTSGCADASLAAPLYAQEYGATAVGSDGRIYDIGGEGSSGPSTTVEAYSPIGNTWSPVAPLPFGFAQGVAVPDSTHQHIYALGPNGFFKYTVSTNTWTQLYIASTPGDFDETGTLGPDGKIYILGGPFLANQLWAFTPSTSTWTHLSDFPPLVGGYGSPLVTGSDGRLYAVGINAPYVGDSRAVYAYTPSTNSWAPAPSLPEPFSRLASNAAEGADGRIYAFGDSSNVYAYAPGSGAWVHVTTVPKAHSCCSPVSFYHNSAQTPWPVLSDTRIFLVGGIASDGGQRLMAAYNLCSSLPTFTLTGVYSGPPKHAVISVQDASSGLASITATQTINATVTVAPFTPGTTSPVQVSIARTDPTKPASATLQATNKAGCASAYDPVMTAFVRAPGQPIVQTLDNVPPAEHRVTILNDTPGLSAVVLTVNGHTFAASGLHDGEQRVLDIAAGLLQPGNTVRIIGVGRPGASATVLIGS